ncbi:hypothetical protein N1F78_00740 [Seonamhaeicola sp. MEBiC1930]|uniref:hypothetical protein n=1 Tax=Seonamhaeicola sp. MEBiC01930 TaxID=2976768 RepID=UPI00325258A6
MKQLNKLLIVLFIFSTCMNSCKENKVKLTHGLDKSAGGGNCYIITTPIATYYLEKMGGGLSSMIDNDGIDWIGFHKKEGSGHKGEYRGFPNAIHKQDGSYFHALNSKTNLSSSEVKIENNNHIRILFTSDNNKWKGQWDFYEDRCDFTMKAISHGYKYWTLYEGVPGGKIDSTDFWYASNDIKSHPIFESKIGDLPNPEWMAFGDKNCSRMLYVLHHEDDKFPDDYVCREFMTVLGFGRQTKPGNTKKFLTSTQTFSIGFIEYTNYSEVNRTVNQILE